MEYDREEKLCMGSADFRRKLPLPNSAKELSDGLNKMLNEVRQKTTNDKTLISVEITIPDEGGKPQLYADSMEYKLSPLKLPIRQKHRRRQ